MPDYMKCSFGKERGCKFVKNIHKTKRIQIGIRRKFVTNIHKIKKYVLTFEHIADRMSISTLVQIRILKEELNDGIFNR